MTQPHTQQSRNGTSVAQWLGYLLAASLMPLIPGLLGLALIVGFAWESTRSTPRPEPSLEKQTVRLPTLPADLLGYRLTSITYDGGVSPNVMDEYTTHVEATYAQGSEEPVRVSVFNSEATTIDRADPWPYLPEPGTTTRCGGYADHTSCQYTSTRRSIMVSQNGHHSMTGLRDVLEHIRSLR